MKKAARLWHWMPKTPLSQPAMTICLLLLGIVAARYPAVYLCPRLSKAALTA